MRGFNQTIENEIVINAAPSVVKQVFGDFATYPSWSKWKIETAKPGQSLIDLKKNDQLIIYIKGSKYSRHVVHNEPNSFAWAGSQGIVKGEHTFTFQPSPASASAANGTATAVTNGATDGSLAGAVTGAGAVNDTDTGAKATLVRQSEQFTGVGAPMLRQGGSMRRGILDDWNEFFNDLKREAERRAEVAQVDWS